MHQQWQRAKERIKEEITKGKSIKHTVLEAKRVTSGIVFKSGTTRLGQTFYHYASTMAACKGKNQGRNNKR